VTSVLVLAALLGTVGVRLGCAWSCQPSPVTAASTHCHETSVPDLGFSASADCNDVRSDWFLLAHVVRPDAAAFVTADRITSILLPTDDGSPFRPAIAHLIPAAPPHAFAIPLRQ
jgi:hypothetical protein